MRSALFVGSLVVIVAGCGGGAPPAVPPGPPQKPVTPIVAPVAVDLSPVPDPDGLLVVGRITKPEAILKTVGTWTHLPLPGGNDLVKSVTDDAVGDAVDLSQPVDGAIIVSGGVRDPQVFAAFSVAVRSLDDAKAKLGAKHRLVDGKNGSVWVSGIGKSGYEDDKGPRTHNETDETPDDEEGCALAPAAVGARLVCGEKDAVEALTPYLTRNAVKKTWTSDVHLEIRPAAVRQQAAQLRALLPLFARGAFGSGGAAFSALLEAGAGEGVDFLNDTDRIAMDATLGDNGAEATVKVDYQKATSLLARLSTSHPERADAPPAAFFHLPGDTDVALFTKGNDAKLFDHAKELLGNVAAEVTSDAQMPDAEKKAMKDLVVDRMLTLFTGPMVYGKGFDAVALDKAIQNQHNVKPDDWAGDAEAQRALGEQVVGWHLVRVEEPITKVGPIIKDWSALWNRPAFVKWAKSRSSQKMLAQMKISGLPAGVTLPKDAVHLEISFPQHDLEIDLPPPPPPPIAPGAKRAPPPPPAAHKPKKIPLKPIVFHVIAVPDAGATWIGFGLDPKLLAQRAAASLSSASDASSLGKTPTGEALKTTKANGAWMLTLRGLFVFTAFKHSSRSPYAMLGQLPNQGKSPIILSFASKPASQEASAGSSVSTFKLPRGAIEDVVRFAFASR